jgi:hypothetical protein
MPFNQQRGPAQIYENEFLRAFTGQESIKSMVLDSTHVPENPASSGRYVVVKGTVMGKIGGSSKIAPLTAGAFGSGSAGAWVAGDIVGILTETVEVYVGAGAAAGVAADEPVAVMHMGMDLNVSKLIGYTGNETIVKAALPLNSFR